LRYDKKPNTCPVCHYAVDARIVTAHRAEYWAQVVYQCPRAECLRFFIGRYFTTTEPLILHSCEPVCPKPPELSVYVRSISPNFDAVYGESSAAEQLGLSRVCGAGYRKALEFLIKDYAASKVDSDEDREKIRAEWLGQVIKNRIDDARIQSVAERAAWLGNDETHYVRLWTDLDIRDLKTLIDLVVRLIESEELTKAYEARMPKE